MVQAVTPPSTRGAEGLNALSRRLVLALPLVYATTAFSQEAFVHEIVRDIPMPRDRIFDAAVLWLAESVRSLNAVIDLKDKEIGVVVATPTTPLSIGWGAKVPMSFKLKVEVKDNKYRLTFSQVQLNFDYGFKSIEHANRESLEPKARERFNELAGSLHSYLLAAGNAKPW
ncbi:MAG: DUF4468 domain-containing protein [Burkholderiaceae bacterium]|nr:DUF4468 domain-containing protein [Burkholderiaceae bacterium]